jgi:hypothetical protein
MISAGISPYTAHRYDGPPCFVCGSTKYDFGLFTQFVNEEGQIDLGTMMPCENGHQIFVLDLEAYDDAFVAGDDDEGFPEPDYAY